MPNESQKGSVKPQCKCGGMPVRGGMCRYVITGGKLCGAPIEVKCNFKLEKQND